MEFHLLRNFLAVVREGNISRAAAALNMTQPALSRQMMELEAHLGTSLFERGRRIILTDAGQRLYRRADDMARLMSSIEMEFRQDDLSGVITIGTGGLAATEIFAELVSEFRKKHPQVTFDFHTNSADHLKTRCIVTLVALIASGITDSSLKYHLQNAREHGLSRAEIAAVLTHTAFYAGWPKAWAAFSLAREVWPAEPSSDDAMTSHRESMLFPMGEPNNAYAAYFSGRSWVAPVSTTQIGVYNVTFEPGCRNNWHVHHAKYGGGQILICVAGRGFYQEWGKDAVEMHPGDCVNIAAGVKHWHGASTSDWFSHLAVEVPGEGTSNEWLETVSADQYAEINKSGGRACTDANSWPRPAPPVLRPGMPNRLQPRPL